MPDEFKCATCGFENVSPYYFHTAKLCLECFRKLPLTPELEAEGFAFAQTAFRPAPLWRPDASPGSRPRHVSAPPPLPQRILTALAFLSFSISACGFALVLILDLGWGAGQLTGLVSSAALFLGVIASLAAGILYARSGRGRRSMKLLLYVNIAFAAVLVLWFLFILTHFTT